MIIDKTYGPQFDRIDGTVGKTKLVKRWAITNKDGNMAFARQGSYTKGTKAEAETALRNILENNSKEVWGGMSVGAFWCWPFHFDPVGKVDDCLETPQDTSV